MYCKAIKSLNIKVAVLSLCIQYIICLILFRLLDTKMYYWQIIATVSYYKDLMLKKTFSCLLVWETLYNQFHAVNLALRSPSC